MAESIFSTSNFDEVIRARIDEMRKLYLDDEIPWVVGYSGGKDSTATLQMCWMMLEELDPADRHKPIYVITTDTLVENPVVSAWVENSLDTIQEVAESEGLPIEPHLLIPDPHDTFWVNLIGKGYPAPKPRFRWCTERLKINPGDQFVRKVVQDHGEAIMVLGIRKAESGMRKSAIEVQEADSVRDNFLHHPSVPSAVQYAPIVDWTSDDVWMFLMQIDNRWGIDHKDLMSMYRGATSDNECPIVLDTSTPSCGNSRFGCWTCTVVDKDASMQAMIQNDEEKEWMMPLLEIRDELAERDAENRRDFRRMHGSINIHMGAHIRGPYKQEWREHWLRKILEAQTWIREHGPSHVDDITLIRLDEMREIRRIWVVEKHEIEDSLPGIYEDVIGEPFPDADFDHTMPFGAAEMEVLREVCDDELLYELARDLLDVEHKHRTMVRRAGLFSALEDAFRRSFYEDVDDALSRERSKKAALEAAEQGNLMEIFNAS